MDMRSDMVNVISDIEDLMSYKKWFVVIQSGCDVLYSAYDVTHIVGLMSYKMVVISVERL